MQWPHEYDWRDISLARVNNLCRQARKYHQTGLYQGALREGGDKLWSLIWTMILPHEQIANTLYWKSNTPFVFDVIPRSSTVHVAKSCTRHGRGRCTCYHPGTSAVSYIQQSGYHGNHPGTPRRSRIPEQNELKSRRKLFQNSNEKREAESQNEWIKINEAKTNLRTHVSINAAGIVHTLSIVNVTFIDVSAELKKRNSFPLMCFRYCRQG